MDAALGVRAVARIRREVWRKDNVKFNLDRDAAFGLLDRVSCSGFWQPTWKLARPVKFSTPFFQSSSPPRRG